MFVIVLFIHIFVDNKIQTQIDDNQIVLILRIISCVVFFYFFIFLWQSITGIRYKVILGMKGQEQEPMWYS